jgi:subtilase family serine protease
MEMKKRCWSTKLIALSIVSILMLTLSGVHLRDNVSAASPPPKTFAGYIPSAVASGRAHLIGHHKGTDQLELAIGLPLRNQQSLTQVLNEVSTPRNPHYRHYLTQTQANQAFNPTPQQEQQVIGWLRSHGIKVTHTYPNHLLVDVTGTFTQIEQVFHVTINDYTMQLKGKQITFYAPTNEPTVDGSVGNIVDSILGLDDYPRFHVDDSQVPARPAGNGTGHGSPPYYPQDFANAYHVNPLWKAGNNGWGQHIGIVLWGPPPSPAALQQFDAQTGAKPPNLQTILVDGGPIYPFGVDVAEEAGMDVEYTSGMAPGATIDYYAAPDTALGNPTDNGLDDALNMAGTDTNNNAQISDSWGGCEATSISDPFTRATEQILQYGTITGHDYFFSSGDNGSACVPDSSQPCTYTDPYPQYPASSAYVTSVGGTTFNQVITTGYPGEVAWNYTPTTCLNGQGHPPYGSGGGYSKRFARPSWQANFTKNKHRGYPDIAADADLNTGAFVCYDGNNGPLCNPIGGTSLATPLWAGMIADVNELAPVQPLGFITPMLYEMKTGMPYTAYHDIKNGTNGHYKAGFGWDAVTGLGSPNLYNFARDAAYLDASVSDFYGVAEVSANDIWAVGYNISNVGTLTEHWNGSSWTVVPSSNPYGALFSVAAVSANNIWAVGVDGHGGTLTEHWNGSNWTVVPSPDPGPYSNGLSSVAAVSATDIWAVGSYDDSNGNLDTLTEHWNGSNWTVVPSPSPGPYSNGLSSVAAVSATDIWAVGNYMDSNYNRYTLTEHWNGSNWTVVPSPDPGPYSNGLSSVAAVSATDIWAVGDYQTSWGGNNTLIEQWNGTSWNVVPSPSP